MWWDRFWDSGDRAARRSYRRSLPPLYRWRRVLIGLLVLASVIGAVVLTNGSPRAWARDRWSDVFYRDRLQEVWVSEVFIEPADATVNGAPQMLVDNDADAWTMKWTAGPMGLSGAGNRRDRADLSRQADPPDRPLRGPPGSADAGAGVRPGEASGSPSAMRIPARSSRQT